MRAWQIAAAAGVVAAAVVWSRPSVAQTPDSPSAREYLDAAAQSDAFEVLEAQSALTGSANPQVRAYAEMMLRDHAATAEALRAAALESRMNPPAMQVGADQTPLLAALQGLSGEAFDRAYAEHQALAHRSALTVQRAYAAGGEVPALRRVAAAATSVIERHLAEAEQLRNALGA